jgi:pyruvate,water dikinase
MSLFGTLKKLTGKYIVDEAAPTNKDGTPALSIDSLQNDLLCGQGDVESAEPTKLLMTIASDIDDDAALREWYIASLDSVTAALIRITHTRAKTQINDFDDFLSKMKKMPPTTGVHSFSFAPTAVLAEAQRLVLEYNHAHPTKSVRTEGVQRVLLKFGEFLDRFGFRCVNELKLEEPDLHDNPEFVVDAVAGYVRTKSYNISALEERERKIREGAESIVHQRVRGTKLKMYLWVLKHTRKVVKHRENLRFARTKIYGVVRHLIRGMGHNLTQLGHLQDPQQVFYLTVAELMAYADGRSVTIQIQPLVDLRIKEFEEYRKSTPPPERFITRGAAGAWMQHTQVLADLDLLKDLETMDMDNVTLEEGVLKGVSCCPGYVEGVVRVVKNLSEAKGIHKEILVTARTDPGWVPLYPLCSGLLIERGSLLSHSAVVARELGLPTIVGVSGGLMKKLKTGMRVQVDATKGIIRILGEDAEEPNKTEEVKEVNQVEAPMVESSSQ